jgi:hypothetical protein
VAVAATRSAAGVLGLAAAVVRAADWEERVSAVVRLVVVAAAQVVVAAVVRAAAR